MNSDRVAEPQLLVRMRDAMGHRGPDDAGLLVDANTGIACCRLAILDVSQRGHMPMASQDGRHWIVHNGELYNFRELRAYLATKGFTFRSHTDTEVLLNLYLELGPAMLKRCNGMFAFAIWDRRERTLFAARDRLGVKPFYYAIQDQTMLFASEQKAIIEAGQRPQVNLQCWPELLHWRHVAGERTLYKNIFRLLPGHYLLFHAGKLRHQQWWSLGAAVGQPRQSTTQPEPASTQRYQHLLHESIALRRISDVPIGVLLSGGLDSSSIAATLALDARERVSSFTVRFPRRPYDEGSLAQQVAARYNLDYHELTVPIQEIPMLLEEATWLLDEPIMHASDVHLLAISKHAKPLVTVLLSGEGADELMGGYVRYRPFRYPSAARVLGVLASRLPGSAQENRLRKLGYLFARSRAVDRLLFSSAESIHEAGTSVLDSSIEYRKRIASEAAMLYPEPVRQVMYYDQHTYLQSLLDRNDRMTMGASIECREPFLDYRAVEWLASLSTRDLFGLWTGKALLKRAMKDQLPASVLRHRKWGFGAPWSAYLRGIPSLASWVRSLPDNEFVSALGINRSALAAAVTGFSNGDNRDATLVRQLAFTALWHEICINGQRNVLQA